MGRAAGGRPRARRASRPADRASRPVKGQDGFVQLVQRRRPDRLEDASAANRATGTSKTATSSVPGRRPSAIFTRFATTTRTFTFVLKLASTTPATAVSTFAPFGPTLPANNPKCPAAYNAKIDGKPSGAYRRRRSWDALLSEINPLRFDPVSGSLSRSSPRATHCDQGG